MEDPGPVEELRYQQPTRPPQRYGLKSLAVGAGLLVLAVGGLVTSNTWYIYPWIGAVACIILGVITLVIENRERR